VSIEQDLETTKRHKAHCPYWAPHESAALSRIETELAMRDKQHEFEYNLNQELQRQISERDADAI
jgi:hypothetical protein